jgi:hypothetical protein
MNAGIPSTRILWRSNEFASAERFTGGATAGGCRLAGLVVLPIDGEPAEIRYRVELDHGWRTRRARVAIGHHAGSHLITLTADGEGRWEIAGASSEPLDGCIDVDLGFTPATNTLQVRRLGLAVGEGRSLPVAWLAFPELTVQPLIQTYTRLGLHAWRYASGEFTANLLVDANGYVLRYGDDLWRAVVHRSD